jgi:hypothetical protein
LAKLFKIKFSEASDKITGSDTSIKTLEIAILKQLFDFASINSKKISDINLCIDCIGQLKNIDKEDHIKFTKGDFDMLLSSIEKSAGQRLSIWNEAAGLWKQLEKPEEIEV